MNSHFAKLPPKIYVAFITSIVSPIHSEHNNPYLLLHTTRTSTLVDSNKSKSAFDQILFFSLIQFYSKQFLKELKFIESIVQNCANTHTNMILFTHLISNSIIQISEYK